MYPIVVSGRNGISNRQRRKLGRMGLKWDGLACSGVVVTQRTVQKIKYYCQSQHLHFKISNPLGNRNSDYRRIFFIYNKPQMFGKYYICAYCGRLRTKDRLTVDHIYPIGKSSKSLKYQKKLQKKGIKNINDPKNLIGACKACNARKSAKTGFWIIRAKVGKSKYLWYLRWVLRFILILFLIYFVVNRPEFWVLLSQLRKFIESFLV